MKTRQIILGGIPIGGGARIPVQTMCNTDTCNVESTLQQVRRCAELGCDIIRIALPRQEAVASFAEICRQSPLPIVADIHFDWNLAMAALESAAAIRINPGNIRNFEHLQTIAQTAAQKNKVVRVGVNMGSLSPEMEKKYGRGVEAMVQSALQYCRMFEEWGCHNLKVSLKSSDLKTTLQAARQFSALSDIPQHIGLTEAGLPAMGIIKSAIGIGSLLLDGIGDTIRVSLTADPTEEVIAGKRILRALGLSQEERPELISCPTCGRTRINLTSLAAQVDAEIDKIIASGRKINCKKIAVMGCEVNGPGEAGDADIGIAGGNGQGLIFKKGHSLKTVPETQLLEEFLQELQEFIS